MTENSPYAIGEDEASDAREAARREAAEDLKWVLSTAQGRRFIWRLLGECGVYRTSFAPDLASMAHNEGKRSIGLQLLVEVDRHCPEQYLRMQDEQVKARNG